MGERVTKPEASRRRVGEYYLLRLGARVQDAWRLPSGWI